MMGATHQTTGVTAGSLAAVPLALFGVPDGALLVFVVIWIAASTLPDIDHPHGQPTRKMIGGRAIHWAIRGMPVSVLWWKFRLSPFDVGHRKAGGTHTRKAGVIVGFAVAIVVALVPGWIGDWFWLWGLAIIGGWFTHLWGDSRTKSGIPWGKDGKGRLRTGRTFRAGSRKEKRLLRWVYNPAAAASVALLMFVAITF